MRLCVRLTYLNVECNRFTIHPFLTVTQSTRKRQSFVSVCNNNLIFFINICNLESNKQKPHHYPSLIHCPLPVGVWQKFFYACQPNEFSDLSNPTLLNTIYIFFWLGKKKKEKLKWTCVLMIHLDRIF